MNGSVILFLLLFSIVQIVHGWFPPEQMTVDEILELFGSMCPIEGMNTEDRVAQNHTPDVANWTVCSDLCRQRDDCKYWTWRKNNCATMTSFGSTSENVQFRSRFGTEFFYSTSLF